MLMFFLRIIFILSTTLTLVACGSSEIDQPHLPDEQLIQNFQTHRAEFDHLVSMVLEDKVLSRVDDDWTDPEYLNASRVAEYRKLFKVVGTPHGVSTSLSRESIEFISSTEGWAVRGSLKGYLYAERCPDSLGKTLASLDEISSSLAMTSGCRHIEGKWYLYYQGD